ncbi:MAG TPA: FAD-dependent oxidoreductase [Pseudolabrys sp.]|nr:FAD-dependent oxidoreductase [Pseudolabrys sp.]
MQNTARVVVVGGGVVGCSVLYHLARKGWTEAVLCERTELTAGSTWHAAGHVIEYTTDTTVSALNSYGARLYSELEELTGQTPGYHRCGNLRLATTTDRLDEFRRYLGLAEVTGVKARLLSPTEISDAWPLMNMEGVLGGVLNPEDGHIAPADLTQSYATGARRLGAKIYRETEVIGFTRLTNEWIVHTPKGDIRCEHVISCSGNYARQTMDMVGLPAHAVSLKHQYIVTSPVPELIKRREAGLPEMPVMRDPEQMFYVRQEGNALLMGCYEGRGECVFTGGVPKGFGMELFADDLDKLLPYLEKAIERIPVLGNVGIRSVVNGPQPYTPDDLPITGPVFGLSNFWVGEGNPNGVTLSGGIGWQLAEWIVDGAPSIDMSACDPRRFGEFATRNYCFRKTEEAYERTYLIPKPGEELPACRPLKTTAIHDLLESRGAVFGSVYGWERPNWFAPAGVPAQEDYTFYRPKYLDYVLDECRSAQTGTVVADISHGAKFRIAGDGAAEWLSRLVASPLPDPGHRIDAYALTPAGTFRAHFAILREAPTGFLVESAPAEERSCLDFLARALPKDGSLRLENLTGREGALFLSGASAPGLLSKFSRSDIVDVVSEPMDDSAFPLATWRKMTIGYAPVRAVRTDRLGLPGWELHCSSEMLRHVFLQIVGGAEAVRLIGARALNLLRIESGVPAWGAELGESHTPAEVGLIDSEAPRRLVLLDLGKVESLPYGDEPVHDTSGRLIGHTTSGGVSPASDHAIALAFIDAESCRVGNRLSVRLLNAPCEATVVKRAGRGIGLTGNSERET